MRIAFATFTGLRPNGSWPATAASMAGALERAGHDVTRMEVAGISHPMYWQMRKALHRVAGRRFQTARQEEVAKELARSIASRLRGMEPDLVLCTSSVPMAYLDLPYRTAFWTDATFSGMVGFYPEFSRLSEGTLANGMALEARALERVDLAFYASDWAARSAARDHGADPARVHVVPFGPNLERVPDKDDALRSALARDRAKCRLLFIGYDWWRKQGPLVMRVHKALESMGVPTEVTIIGCRPDLDKAHRRVRVLGMLDKTEPKDADVLEKSFRDSHFLFVPSMAECYGMVYAEASAFAVPSIACDVGGVPTVVRDGLNGKLVPSDAQAMDIARWIATAWNDEGGYNRLAVSTRTEYDARLDWSRAAASITAIASGSLGTVDPPGAPLDGSLPRTKRAPQHRGVEKV